MLDPDPCFPAVGRRPDTGGMDVTGALLGGGLARLAVGPSVVRTTLGATEVATSAAISRALREVVVAGRIVTRR